jgi:ankyrin repeat protein
MTTTALFYRCPRAKKNINNTEHATCRYAVGAATINSIEAQGGITMTALMQAVQRNDVTRVRELIAQGVDVSELDASQDAPLVMAAYKGHTEIVRLLLEAGADVTAVDPGMKATALHAAAYAGRADAARLLVGHGIEIDKQGPYNGYTALHDAIWQNNIDVAKILINAGARLDLKNHSGETPLDFANMKKRHEIAALIEAKLAETGQS